MNVCQCLRRAVLQDSWRTGSVLFRRFSTSRQVYARPSARVQYPRWVNSKQQRPKEEEEEDDEGEEEDSSEESSSSSSSSSPADSSPPSTPPSSPPPSSPPARQSIPEVYPHVLALPIARRPLFPGFYKAVVIRNPSVVSAIKDMMKRGQPYLGAFLLRDENADSDIIEDISSVHPVGVFAQITSVFAPQGEEDGLTAVLYPHRRIRINELLKEPTNLPVQTSFLATHGISIASVDNLRTEPYNKENQYIRAFVSEIVSVFKDIAQLNPLFRDQITNFSINQVASNVFDEPDKLADFAAAVSSGEVQELQDVLESVIVEDRLRKALLVLKKELINAQLQSKLARDVDSKIAKRQREYYLMEQLKGIKKELGMESDGKDKLIEKFREREKKLHMPELVKKVFEEELSKLAGLEAQASEANVTRNYLEWLTQIPWGLHTPENFSIPHAQRILDEDHYGLTDLKTRILEFISIGKLLGTVQGKILLLVGPPGVGKTSIGKSIARALERQFFRFSVGGLTDVAEIKGHRRTYIGALPGKIVQALKRVNTQNPLVLIDEIDKIGIGRGVSGDPSSALLEMLDPEQNEAFLDHYLDIPVDLSKILFVCTANSTETIPPPLLDRMEVIEVSGYVSEEKEAIARGYLIPQAKQASGLEAVDVKIDDEAVRGLIKWWCRESGVRGLKKQIEKIFRKAAMKIVQDLGEEGLPEPPKPEVVAKTVENTTPAAPLTESSSEGAGATPSPSDVDPNAPQTSTPPPSPSSTEPSSKPLTSTPRKPLILPSSISIHITPSNLPTYVGPPIYQKDRLYGSPEDDASDDSAEGEEAVKLPPPPPGVSTGLGYLGNGSGALMPIEAILIPTPSSSSSGGGGKLHLTGKLGEVIKESAQIALSYLKSHSTTLGISNDRIWNGGDVHLHMPEGAIPKDGPSAGTALVCSLISLYTQTPISPNIALTGEITLTGAVLPVGGLKEKVLAAHRAGIKKLIVPAGNKADIRENVHGSVKEGVEFVYVREVGEVVREVFPELSAGKE